MAVESNNRIIYVDPNDVYNITGRNGEDIQMTPPYEDFCIAFNLLVTNYDRFGDNSNKIAGKDSNDVEYQLSWVCGNSQAAFLKGDTFGIDNGDSYLTTYYTEIHAGNYGTKKIVEGLGVEKIEVKFESWYTPTVNIKFVDVRGSSIFGNEEAIHTNGELTADNIFGCFFQIPYPLFKLQMKGFLGRPVTYQLTCSGCSHEYNVSTGNFESNVTFIGYSYSLLTDIPFDYLVAAPHCPYIGIAYWNAHVNSREWALHDGSAPIKLSDFLNKIKSALNDGAGKGAGISEGDSATLVAISGKKGLLSKIQSKLSNFVSQITNQASHVIDNTDENGNRQLFLFMGKGRVRVTNADDTLDVSASQGTQNALTELTNVVKEYHDSYGTDGINEKMLPNQKKALTKITANRILSISKSGDTITNMVFTAINGQERTFNNIKNIKFNDEKTVTDSIAKALYDGTTPNSYNTNFTEFAYVVDLYNLAHKVNELTDAATKEEESITRRVASKIEDNIEELVGCKPYIGNVFKIIMCHLETFLQIIFEAGQEIKEQERNGNRSPSALGIHDIDTETDIPRGRSETVPPWPGVLNHKSANTEGDTDSSLDTLAWVGDFSHNFIEENVILSLQSAILHIVDSVHNTNTTVSTDYLPISTVDFLTGTSPFDSVTNEIEAGPSAVAGLVSLRATLLMGIMCNDSVAEKFAETFGKFDAYNCYSSQTADLIDTMLIKPIEGQNGAETLIDIATCSTNGDTFASVESGKTKKSHDFETAQRIKDSYNRNGRHPMMLVGSNSYTYIHYYDGNGNSIVPSTLFPFREYATRGIIKQRGDDPTNYSFNPLFKDDGKTAQNWAYLCNSNSILSDDGYANESMFSVFTDKSMVDGIIDYYDRLCDGHVDIVDTGCDGDFGDFTKTFLKVDGESYSKWFSKTTSLTPKRKDMGVDEKYLLPLSSDGDAPHTFQLNKIYITDNANKRVVKANTDGTFKTSIDDTPRNADELTIPYFPINHIGVEGNLFGCPFYYIQTKSITASEDDNARNRRAKRVKALLFLHTLKYDYSKVPNVFKDTKTNGCIESIPYGMLLMFGGLLWRSRYIKENGRDPVVYNAEKMSLNYWSATKNNLAEEYTLFHKEDGCYNFSAQTSGSSYNYNVSVASLFGKGNDAGNRNTWWPDTNIANRLITVFEEFVDSGFNTIRNAFEIHDRSGNTYTSKSIVGFMKTFVGYVRGTDANYN
ncbi:MAG: hypothetical protein LUC17_00765, partial [Oscillospiraceae bacterium]|nr:hypothetical protein [Oscillospiraceae bacterium]